MKVYQLLENDWEDTPRKPAKRIDDDPVAMALRYESDLLRKELFNRFKKIQEPFYIVRELDPETIAKTYIELKVPDGPTFYVMNNENGKRDAARFNKLVDKYNQVNLLLQQNMNARSEMWKK